MQGGVDFNALGVEKAHMQHNHPFAVFKDLSHLVYGDINRCRFTPLWLNNANKAGQLLCYGFVCNSTGMPIAPGIIVVVIACV